MKKGVGMMWGSEFDFCRQGIQISTVLVFAIDKMLHKQPESVRSSCRPHQTYKKTFYKNVFFPVYCLALSLFVIRRLLDLFFFVKLDGLSR